MSSINEKKSTKLDSSINQILTKSVVNKSTKVDIEEVLQQHLLPKFGERFKKYRKKYLNFLADSEHKHLPDYPISVILELVNRCNLECTFCYQGYRNDAEKKTLSIKDLEKLFQDFKKNKLDALLLSQSEPLLYKNFDKILEMAEKAEIMDQFIFTNGVLLNEKNSKKILASSLTRLFISIDAATSETYDQVRIPVGKNALKENRLKKIEENVKNFVKLRNSMGLKIPLVRVSFIALEKNVHEVNDFIEKWIDIVDSVEIQKESSIELYDQLLKKKYDKNKLLLKKYNCNDPWGQVSVNSDGSVGPCCSTVGRNLPMGNILKNSLKEIWEGQKLNKIRQSFRDNKPNRVCQLCLENKKINL